MSSGNERYDIQMGFSRGATQFKSKGLYQDIRPKQADRTNLLLVPLKTICLGHVYIESVPKPNPPVGFVI
jgi:hypothetical protein